MRYSYSSVLALAAGAAAQSRGFNYGSTAADGSAMTLSDFTTQFNAAKALSGTNGEFTSARLYTMQQAGTTGQPIAAIEAAVNTGTNLLLGLWASGGQDYYNEEIAALEAAISQYGDSLASRVVGISVGSEDLYRISPTGIENHSGVGAEPDTLVSYIDQLRKVIAGGPLADKVVGHVDTYNAWINGSNSAVVNAVDFLGMDAYPYFQTTDANSIGNAESLFFSALDATKGASTGKPVWVTETGWPVSGATENLAVPSTANAETYWQDVACRLLSDGTNVFWFTLDDAGASPSFSVANPSSNFSPLYDLSCSASASSSSSSAVAATSSAASSSAASASSSVAAVSSAASAVSSAAAASSSSIGVGVGPVVVKSSSSMSTFQTVPMSASSSVAAAQSTSAAAVSSTQSTVVLTSVVGGAAPMASSSQNPAVVYSTAVVPATAAQSSANAAATTASTSAQPAEYTGAAARVAGGAAAGLVAVGALFL